MTTLDETPKEMPLRLLQEAKLTMFEGLWTLAMLHPTRYSLLIKCGDKRDYRYGQGPYVLIERSYFILDKDHDKSSSMTGQIDMAVSHPILEGDAAPEFVHCNYIRAVEEREAYLMAHEPDINRKLGRTDVKFRISEFCCDLFRKASAFFLYDRGTPKRDGKKRGPAYLMYYGHFPPMGKPTPYVLSVLEGLKQRHGAKGQMKGKWIRHAYTSIQKASVILNKGDERDDHPAIEAECEYIKPFELDLAESLENRQAQLRFCLKYAAEKLLKKMKK